MNIYFVSVVHAAIEPEQIEATTKSQAAWIFYNNNPDLIEALLLPAQIVVSDDKFEFFEIALMTRIIEVEMQLVFERIIEQKGMADVEFKAGYSGVIDMTTGKVTIDNRGMG